MVSTLPVYLRFWLLREYVQFSSHNKTLTCVATNLTDLQPWGVLDGWRIMQHEIKCKDTTQGHTFLTLRFSCWMKVSIQYENIHYWLDQHTTTSHVLQSKSGNPSNIISYRQTCRMMKSFCQTNIVLSFVMSPKQFRSDFKLFLDYRKREWSNSHYLHVRNFLKLLANINKVISFSNLVRICFEAAIF